MTTDSYINLGRKTALISFLTGSIVLLLYYISLSTYFAFIGLFFMLLAAPVNVIILIILLFKANTDISHRKKLLTTTGIMMLNIPVVLLYFFLGGVIANTLRITFNNHTKSVLTNIHITGCAIKHIDKLNAGGSETITLKIPGDCAVNINYMQNGVYKKATVAGYITNDGAQQLVYNIGGHNDPF